MNWLSFTQSDGYRMIYVDELTNNQEFLKKVISYLQTEGVSENVQVINGYLINFYAGDGQVI